MQTKPSILYPWHEANNAQMGDFGGYRMPLWYPTGTKTEHLSVIQSAGIFDTSHMAAVSVTGPDAFNILQTCFTKDLNRCIGMKNLPLCTGRCAYGAFLNPDGECIDDAILYQIRNEDYLVIVNAGMGSSIASHISSHSSGKNITVTDLTDKVGKFDVQGPNAAKIMKVVLKNPEKVFEGMPYFSFKGHYDKSNPLSAAVQLIDGTPILLSRTGYTGEFGFELFMLPEHLVKVWEMILNAGNEFSLTPCGLACRDSLRAGAVLPLSHQDIGAWPFINHPWPFALPYNEDRTEFTKSFTGDKALTATGTSSYTYAFAGRDPRKISAHEETAVLDNNGNNIGRVLTCTTDMAIGLHEGKILSIANPDLPENFKPRGLCCGFVKVNTELEPGRTIIITDNRRKLKVTVTEDIRPDRTARKPLKEML